METLKLKNINLKSGYRIELSENSKGQPTAKYSKLLSSGKNKGEYKRIEHFYFHSEERRSEYVNNLVKKLNERSIQKENEKKALQEVRNNMKHDFKVGDIYYDSWGYEQTNVDFYQVVEVLEKSVKIRSINGVIAGRTGHDCANVKPVKDSFTSEPELKKVLFYIKDGSPVFYIKSRHGWISKYDSGEDGVYSSWGY